MAQADQVVQNDTFPIVRADINNNLAALFTNSSGGTSPTVTVAYQDWIDTSGTDPIWKKRNAANNAWITVATIKASTVELAADNVLPSQSGQSGNYLTTNGTVASWGAIPPGSSKDVFTTSGTWTKPGTGTVALVTIWGGGGGGGKDLNDRAGGGGGGACTQVLYQLSDLPSSVTITIGAGGAGQSGSTGTGGVGGTTTFGALLSAFGGGGGGGSTDADTGGGGGGGSLSAGGSGSATNAGNGGNGHGNVNIGGFGGKGTATTNGNFARRGDWGGGGGGGAIDTQLGAGAYWGGAGGGGCNSTTEFAGGLSLNGGNGATSNTGNAGSVPGGGGGGSRVAAAGGDGGAGLCIIYVW
jgi:hypothetical protein